jgi:hypothetical protein
LAEVTKGIRTSPPHPDFASAGLKRRHLLEFRRVVPQILVQRIRVNREATLQAAEDTTVIAIADPEDALRVGHRQRLQHERVYQCEDPGIGPDPQRQRQQGGDGEALGRSQMAQSKTYVIEHIANTCELGKRYLTIHLSNLCHTVIHKPWNKTHLQPVNLCKKTNPKVVLYV